MYVLKHFYLKTRPWGFWRPVLEELKKENPDVEPNREFGKDTANVLVGLIWHTSLTAAPIFMVIQHWTNFTLAMGVVVASSIFLKLNWWNKLQDHPGGLPSGTTPGPGQT